jgi:hypothetical protein
MDNMLKRYVQDMMERTNDNEKNNKTNKVAA